MCLLVVLHRSHPDSPLIVAANRDELLAREATAMTLLEEGPPRVLGGRDHAAGGTWLAINEHGVVGGLTNRPSGERDPSRRSRGEWPIFLARYPTAAAAATAFAATFAPADFNPGWVLVADARDLFYIDMTRSTARPVALDPGVHILENRPLGGPSAKVDEVRRRLAGIEAARGDELDRRLRRVLAGHAVPPSAGPRRDADGKPVRPPEAEAACVHLGAYGTRSATLVRAMREGPPRVWSADGPPCTAPLVEATGLWAVRRAAAEAGAGG